MIVLNTSNNSESIALDLEHYIAGGNYYIYTLQPDNGDPFNPKVRVNGTTNSYYSEGGPFSYEEVPAMSYETDGLVQLEVPPYSASYLLIEGMRLEDKNVFEVEVELYAQMKDSVYLLPGGFVAIGSTCDLASENGKAIMNVPAGNYTMQFRKHGFQPESVTVMINSDTLIKDTLHVGHYGLALVLRDCETGLPIGDLSVYVDDQIGLSNEVGMVNFDVLTGGIKTLDITGKGYSYSGAVDLFSDTTYTILVEKKAYDVALRIKDRYTNRLLNGMEVAIGEEILTTDTEGEVLFELVTGDYKVSVSGPEYESRDLNLSVYSDTLVEEMLEPLFAEVQFKIYEDETPLNNVEVVFNEQSKSTNALGMCIFDGLPTKVNYLYQLNYTGYIRIEDDFFLRADTLINLQMKVNAISDA